MESTDATWTDDDGNTWNVHFVEDDDGNLVSVTVESDTGEALPLTTLTRGIPFQNFSRTVVKHGLSARSGTASSGRIPPDVHGLPTAQALRYGVSQ